MRSFWGFWISFMFWMLQSWGFRKLGFFFSSLAFGHKFSHECKKNVKVRVLWKWYEFVTWVLDFEKAIRTFKQLQASNSPDYQAEGIDICTICFVVRMRYQSQGRLEPLLLCILLHFQEFMVRNSMIIRACDPLRRLSIPIRPSPHTPCIHSAHSYHQTTHKQNPQKPPPIYEISVVLRHSLRLHSFGAMAKRHPFENTRWYKKTSYTTLLQSLSNSSAKESNLWWTLAQFT